MNPHGKRGQSSKEGGGEYIKYTYFLWPSGNLTFFVTISFRGIISTNLTDRGVLGFAHDVIELFIFMFIFILYYVKLLLPTATQMQIWTNAKRKRPAGKNTRGFRSLLFSFNSYGPKGSSGSTRYLEQL